MDDLKQNAYASDSKKMAIEIPTELRSLLASHRTLEDVVRWALAQDPPKLFADARSAREGDAREIASNAPGFDLVVQDEYTHDVVVPYAENVFLVYDTT